MPNLTLAASALTDMAQLLDLTAKSVASVARRFRADMRSLAVIGFTGTSSILGDMRGIVKNAVADAYTEGLKEGGISFDEMSDDDATMIIELGDAQLAFVNDFVKAIREARSDKAAQRDILDNRIPMWTTAIEMAGVAGTNSAKANEMVVFGGEDGEESCATCRRMKGKRHRRKWWEQNELVPQDPRFRESFECGGWRCAHELIPIR